MKDIWKKYSCVLSSPSLENINQEKLASKASQENSGKIAFLTTNYEQIAI